MSLISSPSETKFHVKPLPHARIPIVKLTLDPSPGLPFGIACDIGFENRLALKNTRLLMCYAMIDPARVRTMVLFRTSTCLSQFSLLKTPPAQSKSGPNGGASSQVPPCLDLIRSFQEDQFALPRNPVLLRLCFTSFIFPHPRQESSCVTKLAADVAHPASLEGTSKTLIGRREH